MSFLEQKDVYKIWVFAPFIETDDPNLQYYCDYTQSIAEYTQVFANMGCDWEWVNVTMRSFEQDVLRVKAANRKKNIVLNLCDGDELNGGPGVSVIHALDAHEVVYTGSNAFFYDVTTSKITMKKAFDAHQVATPNWVILDGKVDATIFDKIGDTAIVKPAIAAGSMGLTIKNVVTTVEDLENILTEIQKGYHGWKLDADGLIAEQFIKGREFTTFLVGSADMPDKIQFYAPVERVFHASLPEKEQFLSFDRLWETYDDETPMPDGGHLYEYASVEPALIPLLQDLSLRAYQATQGIGYGRLDIRMDKKNQQLYVLEVNAQCGLSDDENFTSIGAILRYSHKTFTELITAILEDALQRRVVVGQLEHR
jgi:D-alanine-D-alanine ligase